MARQEIIGMAEQHDKEGDTNMESRGLLRRRGLMAGAAALVAGMAVAKTAENVSASDGSPLICGSQANTSSSETRLTGAPAANTSLLHLSATNGPGLGLECYAGDTGVLGYSLTKDGVNGTTNISGGQYAGVQGFAVSGGNGVIGESSGANGYGVWGKTDDGRAVVGTATGNGTALHGQGGQYGVIGRVASLPNTVAVFGYNQSANGTNNIGVYGVSNTSYGVFGVSNKPGFSGCTGGAYVAGTAAFAGGTAVPGAYAAYFTGPVVVDGDFTVLDPTRKHGAIMHPDGSHRTLYSMESPESWMEDFGKGTLAGGRAEVKLDAEFAAIARTDDYHVFLTEYGAHNGLFITTQTGTGFVVQAEKASASGMFGYRVVAKPKTDKKAQRLAKVEVPQIAIPGVNDLPKPPPALTAEKDGSVRSTPPPPPNERGTAPAGTRTPATQPAPTTAPAPTVAPTATKAASVAGTTSTPNPAPPPRTP